MSHFLNEATPFDWDKAARTNTGSSALDTQVGGDHYKGLKIQPIEYILANDLNYCEANIVKYITRHATKGGATDVNKVIHYAQLLLETKYGIKP